MKVKKSPHSTGIIATILQAKILLPFSRMSYAAYMLNALISTFLFMLSETPLHVDLANFVILLCFII